MSRAAIYSAISSDDALNDLGIDEDSLFTNYSMDEKPLESGPFVILRWEDQKPPVFSDVDQPITKSARTLTVWAHYPVESSTDFTRVDAILNRIDEVLRVLEQVSGDDGEIVTLVTVFGRSGDLHDEAFKTISRNARYEVLSRINPNIEDDEETP